MFLKYWRSFSPKWSVGLDIGSDNVKLVCLAEKENTFELMAHAVFKRSNIDAIRKTMKHVAIKGSDIRVGIKDPKLIVQKLELPEVPEAELDEIVKWAVKDLSAPVEEHEFRFQRIGDGTGTGRTTHPYMAFALEKEKITKHLERLKELGVSHIKVIEPDINALAHSVLYNYMLKKDDRFAVIDIGKSESVFAVVSPKGLVFSSHLQGISGGELTSMVSEDHGVSEEEAEKYKTQTPDLLRGNDAGNTEGVIQYLSKTAIAIQHAFDSYALQNPNEPVTHLLLTGGGSRLKILRPYIQDTLKFPTEFLKVFDKIDTKKFAKINFEQVQEFFGTAIGLAL